MELSNEIVLRPRFKFNVSHDNESLLSLFEKEGKSQSEFIVTRVDDHVFIKIPKAKQHFWSPQLHLEINEDYDNEKLSTIYGLFGPNPTVWTMFMFLHFAVAGLFIASCIWLYTRSTLNEPTFYPLIIMILMVIIWIILYVIGRIGRRKGSNQMIQLHTYINSILSPQHKMVS